MANTSGWPGSVQSGSTMIRPGSIDLGTGRRGEDLCQRGRLHTCGPHLRPGFDALLTAVIPDGDPIRVDRGGRRGTPYFDTHPLEGPRGVPLKSLVEGTKDGRAGLDEHDSCLTRVDLTVVAGQDAMRELGNLADDLDAGRARPPPRRRTGTLRVPPGRSPSSAISNAPSMWFRRWRASSSVFIPGANSAQSSCPKYAWVAPAATTKVSYGSVIRAPSGAMCRHGSRVQVEIRDFAEYNFGVLLFLHDAAQCRRNQPLGQDAGGNLIQQRLEEMVVRPVDHA